MNQICLACIGKIQEHYTSTNDNRGDNEKSQPRCGHTQSFCCYAAHKMSKEFQMRFLFSSTTERERKRMKKKFTVTTYQRRRDTKCECVSEWVVWIWEMCVRMFCVYAAHCRTPLLQSKYQFREFFFRMKKCVNHTGLNYLKVPQCVRDLRLFSVASCFVSLLSFCLFNIFGALRCAVGLSMSILFRVLFSVCESSSLIYFHFCANLYK